MRAVQRSSIGASYDAKLEAEIVEWIGQKTGDMPTGEFGLWLKDGQVLCRLVNALQPGVVPKVYSGNMPFRQMENMSAFLKACRRLGVNEYDLFETVDLFELKDLGTTLK